MATGDQVWASDIEARVQASSVLRFHHMFALIVGAGLIIDSLDIALGSNIAAALVADEGTSVAEAGWLATATVAGLAIGGFCIGALADRFGRVALMRWTMALIGVATLAAALSSDIVVLACLRGVAAVGLGAETVLAYGVLSEFMPRHTRGRWIAWVAFIASVGLPMSSGLAALILPAADGWRWLLAGVGVLALIMWAIRLRLPESPIWLAKNGRIGDAQAVIARMGLSAFDVPQPAEQVGATDAEGGGHKLGAAHTLFVGAVLHVAALTSMYGFVSWLPIFLVERGHGLFSASLFAAIMSAGAPIGTMIAFLISDRFDRKTTIVVAAIGAALMGGLYAHAPGDAVLVAAGVGTVALIYVFSVIGLMTYTPEIFDTGTRMRSLSFVSTVGRLAGIAAPAAAPALVVRGGDGAVIGAVAAILIIASLVVVALGPSTRR